jgi:hypothetical protein
MTKTCFVDRRPQRYKSILSRLVIDTALVKNYSFCSVLRLSKSIFFFLQKQFLQDLRDIPYAMVHGQCSFCQSNLHLLTALTSFSTLLRDLYFAHLFSMNKML